MALKIDSLSPISGKAGSSVIITGSGFGNTQADSKVTFNGVVAAITSWGNTSMIAIVPPRATNGDVVVTVGGVQSNGVYFKTGKLRAPKGIRVKVQ
jgi:hypothetical protein